MGHEGHDHGHDHSHDHDHDHDHGHDHGHDHSHAHDHTHAHAPGAPEEHKAHAPATVACFLVTSSDSRNEKTDASGKVMRELVEGAGHTVVGQALIKDEPAELRRVLDELAPSAGARAVVISGGTGIGRRDITVETLAPLLEKRLDGFGELFRMLSWEEIGSAAMMSRALAGTYKGMVVFAVPGSPKAAKLALERLILPELGHAVREISR